MLSPIQPRVLETFFEDIEYLPIVGMDISPLQNASWLGEMIERVNVLGQTLGKEFRAFRRRLAQQKQAVEAAEATPSRAEAQPAPESEAAACG